MHPAPIPSHPISTPDPSRPIPGCCPGRVGPLLLFLFLFPLLANNCEPIHPAAQQPATQSALGLEELLSPRTLAPPPDELLLLLSHVILPFTFPPPTSVNRSAILCNTTARFSISVLQALQSPIPHSLPLLLIVSFLFFLLILLHHTRRLQISVRDYAPKELPDPHNHNQDLTTTHSSPHLKPADIDA